MYSISVKAVGCAMVRREYKESVWALAEGVSEPGCDCSKVVGIPERLKPEQWWRNKHLKNNNTT
jgi:hypothetical protein